MHRYFCSTCGDIRRDAGPSSPNVYEGLRRQTGGNDVRVGPVPLLWVEGNITDGDAWERIADLEVGEARKGADKEVTGARPI